MVLATTQFSGFGLSLWIQTDIARSSRAVLAFSGAFRDFAHAAAMNSEAGFNS